MKFFAIIACTLLVGLVASEPMRFPYPVRPLLKNNDFALRERQTAEINEYVDNVLKVVSFWLVKNGLDPFSVENIEKGFSAKVGLITFKGELTLTHGWLQGLSEVTRSGDASLTYEKQLLTLQVPVVFDTAVINYDYKAKFMNLGPSGGVEGKIKNLKLFVDVLVDAKNAEIELQTFKITDAGKITLKFSGNPIVDWFSNILSGVATTVLHGVATNVIEKEVRGLLEKVINDINNGIRPTGF